MASSSEISYFPTDALGPDLEFQASVAVSGTITPKHVKEFVKARRKGVFSSMTVYYAGVTAPAISAGAYALAQYALMQIQMTPQYVMLGATLMAAASGISWYLIFQRLTARGKSTRDTESTHQQRVTINARGVEVSNGGVTTYIKWSAVTDICCTSKYLVIVADGAQDVFMPLDWFDGREHMEASLKKIAALRPPPFA